jgi:hypothetical protein
MSATITRNYKKKDVEMLTASEIVIENAIANKVFLQSKRTIWADPFFQDLKTKINNVSNTYLGTDAAKEMRQSTQILLEIQKNALTDLAEFKVQVEEDFKKDQVQNNEIMIQLGFTNYYKLAQKKDQEGLVNLLFQFKKNLTPTLGDLITKKGTSQTIINSIIGYADTLRDANIDQETFKGTRTEITDEAIIAFNEVYDDVISIAKIANKFFKSNKAKQELFSFTKVANTLNSSNLNKKTPPKV